MTVAMLAGTAGAAEYSIEPSISLRGEYDDNIRLTSGPHDSVWGTYLSPGLKLNYQTERTLISGGAQVNIRRYSGDDTDDLDANDVLLNLLGRHKFETASLGLKVDHIRDSTLATELEETGLVQTRRQRRSTSIRPDWTVQLTERTSLALGYRYLDVSYEDSGAGTSLTDYRSHSLFSTLRYQLTPRDEASATLTRSRLEPQDSPARFDTTSLLVGYSRQFTETLTGSAALGVAHIESDDVATGDTSSTRALANLGVEKRLETGKVGARLSRDVTPSGAGGLVQADRAGVELIHKLQETLALGLTAAAYRTRFVGGTVFASMDSRYYQVEPKLTWNLTREWALDAGYRYRRVKFEADGTDDASSNTVYVTATYNWPKIAISR